MERCAPWSKQKARGGQKDGNELGGRGEAAASSDATTIREAKVEESSTGHNDGLWVLEEGRGEKKEALRALRPRR